MNIVVIYERNTGKLSVLIASLTYARPPELCFKMFKSITTNKVIYKSGADKLNTHHGTKAANITFLKKTVGLESFE